MNEVAKHMNVGRNTVGKWLKRYREAGNTCNKLRKGRPRGTKSNDFKDNEVNIVF